LALIFALHYYKPSPLYCLDEIDAALDYKNVAIIANYLKQRTKNCQFLIISLRNNMFEKANLLIGIYKTQEITKTIAVQPSKFIKKPNFECSTGKNSARHSVNSRRISSNQSQSSHSSNRHSEYRENERRKKEEEHKRRLIKKGGLERKKISFDSIMTVRDGEEKQKEREKEHEREKEKEKKKEKERLSQLGEMREKERINKLRRKNQKYMKRKQTKGLSTELLQIVEESHNDQSESDSEKENHIINID
jgi:hypothetical protein